MRKYKDEDIILAVKMSRSFNETQRNLGAGKSGSVYMNLKARTIEMEIDTSHFDPYWNSKNTGGFNKKHFKDTLIIRKNKTREKSHRLRRAMLEYGFDYKCDLCSLKEWSEQEINLQIDHINGISFDNRPENIRFLCPNCHSQTNNYGYKGKDRKE